MFCPVYGRWLFAGGSFTLPSMVDKTQRRLAAILAADVAGYTRLVEQDTDGTVAAWAAARDDVVKPLVDKKSGQIIKFTGDGFLVEFPSVQNAVACAITMQEDLRSSSLNFRMGINVSTRCLVTGISHLTSFSTPFYPDEQNCSAQLICPHLTPVIG